MSKAPSIYFADLYEGPGSVYCYDPVKHAETRIYTRPSGRRLNYFLFAPWDTSQLYFLDLTGVTTYANIYRKSLKNTGEPEEIAYTHATQISDIAVKDEAHYFSEASGAGGDGKIWRIDLIHKALGLGISKPTSPFYKVRLSDVDGFWAGNFAFDKAGVLYLSNGNRAKPPASIYRVDTATNKVAKVFTDSGAIMGMAFGDDGFLYYANLETSIYRLNLANKTKTVVYTSNVHQTISDVRFKP